jgi:hypothetical protein
VAVAVRQLDKHQMTPELLVLAAAELLVVEMDQQTPVVAAAVVETIPVGAVVLAS